MNFFKNFGLGQFTRPDKPATTEGLRELRKTLLDSITESDFFWFPVKLEGALTAAGDREQIEIEVSNPVKVRRIYLPVTGAETGRMARWLGAYPLTGAVADRLYKAAHKAPYQNQNELEDYFKSSDYFQSVYWPYENDRLVFGAHKLWLLSNHGRRDVDCKPVYGKKGEPPKRNPALKTPPSNNPKTDQRPLVAGLQRVEACNNEPSVNYGFYKQRGKNDVRPNGGGGPALPASVAVVQSLGGKHDANHWDYSQLLQLMRFKKQPGTNDRILEYRGEKYSMGMALMAGLPFLWDEPVRLTSDDLPW